eukprot:g7960.t1
MTLGYVAAFSETLALAVATRTGMVSTSPQPVLRGGWSASTLLSGIQCMNNDCLKAIKQELPDDPDQLQKLVQDHVKAAAAWSLGQIGRHSPDHARALAEADVLRRILAVYLHQEHARATGRCALRMALRRAGPPTVRPVPTGALQDSSEDLQLKAKRALKSVVQKCTHLPALEPLLDSPPNILKYVVQQFAKVLPNNVEARKAFVQSGSLQKLQEVQAESGSKLQDEQG